MPNYKEAKLYNGAVTILFDDSIDPDTGKQKHIYYLVEAGKKKRLCGVTTFIGVLDKPALIPWAVGVTIDYVREHLNELQNDSYEILEKAKKESQNQKDIAGEIGKQIHKWVEQHIKGEQPEMPEDDRVLMGINNFIDWVAEYKVEFKASEILIYSQSFNYVGCADIIATIDGQDYLLDIKTSNQIYQEVRLQTAAYKMAYEEETGKKLKGRWVLRISKENEDEYIARMEKKGKPDYPPFKIFEAVNLGEDTFEDFNGFTACMELYRWKQGAKIC